MATITAEALLLNGVALGPASTGLNAPTGGASGNLQVSDAGSGFTGTMHGLRLTASAKNAASILATAQNLGLAA